MLEDLLNDWVFALASTAEVVEEEFDLDARLAQADGVAGVGTVDRV